MKHRGHGTRLTDLWRDWTNTNTLITSVLILNKLTFCPLCEVSHTSGGRGHAAVQMWPFTWIGCLWTLWFDRMKHCSSSGACCVLALIVCSVNFKGQSSSGASLGPDLLVGGGRWWRTVVDLSVFVSGRRWRTVHVPESWTLLKYTLITSPLRAAYYFNNG